ncbi:MAG: hypothetical protein BGO12_18925 [Verrucomicrobia bacterium 61-8]|nr:MAG: hypothetical protein BGO12_18925 [Verrucomicrobia bacterium 61-8]
MALVIDQISQAQVVIWIGNLFSADKTQSTLRRIPLAKLAVSSLNFIGQRMFLEGFYMDHRIAEDIQRIGLVAHEGRECHHFIRRSNRLTADRTVHPWNKNRHNYRSGQ